MINFITVGFALRDWYTVKSGVMAADESDMKIQDTVEPAMTGHPFCRAKAA